jgi:hypothetical protein
MTAPLTSLTIALFDASSDGALRPANRLSRSLAELGIDVSVVTFNAVAPDLDISTFDAVFLRGLQNSAGADMSQNADDEAIRAALCKADAAYQVIYGNDDESLEQLVRAIEKICAAPPITTIQPHRKNRSTEGVTPWVWLCDKCSDPVCEHRLLSDLLKQRKTPLSV